MFMSPISAARAGYHDKKKKSKNFATRELGNHRPLSSSAQKQADPLSAPLVYLAPRREKKTSAAFRHQLRVQTNANQQET